MHRAWQVLDRLEPDVRSEVDALLAQIAARTGEEPFSEAGLDRVAEGATLRHLTRRGRSGELEGYGLIALGATYEAEAAYGTYDDGFARLVEDESHPAAIMLRDVHEGDIGALEDRGWRVARRVHRMSRPLPAPPPEPVEGVEQRGFRVGVDEGDWLEANNSAFVGHPVQATMTPERLHVRERAEWFDPEALLMFWEGGRLAASCWTKMRVSRATTVGEIYVIFVAPYAQGRRLGRAAVLSGLSRLTSSGATRAELYVEATNEGAIALYVSLGFAIESTVVEVRLG